MAASWCDFADKPRFQCHRSHFAKLHARDVSIICIVRHNPAPSELYVTWHRGEHHRLDTGDSLGDYSLMESVGIIANEKQRSNRRKAIVK